MLDSTIFYIISSLSTLMIFCCGIVYKSKCSDISILYDCIKIKRDTNNEEKYDELELQKK